jgi:hypothetical protein
MFEANKKRPHGSDIKISEFYNQVVNDNLNCKADYIVCRRSQNQEFSFIKYPFILNPQLKSEYLQIDNNKQMRSEYERVLVSQYFGATEADPFLILEVNRDSLISDTIMQVIIFVLFYAYFLDSIKRCIGTKKGPKSQIHQ